MASMNIVLYIFVSIFIAEFTSGYKGCEVTLQRRECEYRSVEGVIATCDGHNVEQKVPQNIPGNVKFLVLKNFNFSKILGKDDFAFFKEVECMTVTNSVVNELSDDVFAKMPALRELILKGTHLTKQGLSFLLHPQFQLESLTVSHSRFLDALPDASSWDKLKNLRGLTLNYNSLKRIPANLYMSLRSLEKLDLSHNALDSLEWEGLNQLPRLSILLLNNNHLQTIPDAARQVFYAVKKLHLGRNPWHCNCYLEWFHEFMKRHSDSPDRILDESHVHCHNGSQASKGEVRHLGKNHFTCKMPNAPKIHWVESKKGMVEMTCSSRADPPPTLTIVMSEGQQSRRKSMIIPPSDDLSHSETSSLTIITPAGWVSCYAENSLGNSDSTSFVGHYSGAGRANSGMSSIFAVLAVLIIKCLIFN